MSRLSVYWPDELETGSVMTRDPMILPFPTLRSKSKSHAKAAPMDVITRARVLFANRQCEDCNYPVVEPVELPDSAVNQSGLAIPGTATLVGFRCCGCQHEWSI